MKSNKIVMWCCVVAGLVCLLTIYQFWGKREDYVVTFHTKKVKEYVESLERQSLDETFAGLLDNERYFYPGYHPEIEDAPREMEELLSSRGFLKVIQQFEELPKEQGIEKLHLFHERAFKEFETSLDNSVARAADPLLWESETVEPIPTPNVMGAKYMICTAMLLAARTGEYKLLIDQINAMQPLTDSYVERVREYNPPEPEWDSISRSVASLEDDCILTVLMYAVKQRDTDLAVLPNIPLDQKCIPLFRWNAEVTYYDVLPQRGLQKLDFQEAVEQFTVYAFPKNVDDQQKKIIMDTLKKKLSEQVQ